MRDDRQGCLAGLFQLFLLNKLYDWLQKNFGFGRGCMGFGCGLIFLCIFLFFLCQIVTGTEWLKLF